MVDTPEGYETEEISYAKDHARSAIEEELEQQGLDPYSEHSDQSSPDLIGLADAVVERLLKEGVSIPEGIRPLHQVDNT